MKALRSTVLVVLISFTIANAAQAVSYEWRRTQKGVRCHKVTPDGRPYALADDDECRRSQGSVFKRIRTAKGERCYEVAPNGGVIGFADSKKCP
jgi:hypothetical protein